MIESVAHYLQLMESDNAEVRNLSRTESASESVWRDIIAACPMHRSWIALNRTINDSILLILAQDPDPDVRLAVAMRRKLSREIFELLARDTDPGVRSRVGVNKKVPQDILNQLIQDPDPFVSGFISDHLNRQRH